MPQLYPSAITARALSGCCLCVCVGLGGQAAHRALLCCEVSQRALPPGRHQEGATGAGPAWGAGAFCAGPPGCGPDERHLCWALQPGHGQDSHHSLA